DTLPSYIGTVDNLMIYENPGLPLLSVLQGWHTGYDKSNFSMIAFGVNSISTSFLSSASNYVGYIDLTNDVLDNPYDSVPPYFGTLVADLDTGSSSPTVPSQPTGLAATSVSSSQINLSWTAPSNNGGSTITGYKIERSTNAGSTWSTLIANTASSSTTYSNTGLASNTSYSYRVSAINSVGTSPVSNTASATTGTVATAPLSPTGLTANMISSSQINLSWTAGNNGGSTITGYKIERSSDNGSTWSTIVSNTGNTATTYSNTGLAASTTYTYQVSEINAIGTSSPSSTASATTGITVTIPQAPTGLAASVVSSSQINLSWTAGNNGGSAITGYKIERSSDAGTTWGTLVSNTGSTITTYSNTGLAANTTYTYRVSAINSVGTSLVSNTVSATTSGSSTTSTISLTVNSVDLTGTAFSGMYVELHASNETVLATGYTPMTFTVPSGSAYTVVSSNYQNYVFNHWGDGTTNSSITVSPTQNTTLTEYYSTAPVTVTLKVKSVDLSGNPITGLWTVIKSNGVVVAKGYTTLTFTATPGMTYKITMSNYQNYVFNHWSTGGTSPTKTVTPTQNLTVVAYYNS
ncbi:MAG: fibronectin type III domain-containing protein, partial [Nitrosotalea sp.]